MATISEATEAVEAIKERLSPALETLDENVRRGRRLVVKGRHAAEDAAAAATLQVRRHPLGTVLVAAGAGALMGGLIGLALGWQARGARSRP
jgi:ElaB/YqjD/DUF883 family membrane-anchored ribosome-binding protein